MLTIAYIGNGKSTNRYHLPFVLTRDHLHVKTIYSRRPSGWAPVPGVAYVDDIQAIWGDPEIDLVVVCTHSDSHVPYARAALQHGKHVLVEKPFAGTAAEAREVFALADELGLFAQCFQNRRFDSDFLTVQKVIETGLLGDVFEVDMHYDYYRPEVPSELVPQFSTGWSLLHGHGVHTLDQALSYFGSPPEVRYDVRQLLGPGRMNDYYDVDLHYPGLKVSVKSSYFRVRARPRFVVHGTRGVFVKETQDRQEEHLKLFYLPGSPGFGIDAPEHYGTLTYYDGDGRYHEEKVVSEVGDYGRVYDGVHASIVEGGPKVIRDEQTVELVSMLEEGTRAMVEREALRAAGTAGVGA